MGCWLVAAIVAASYVRWRSGKSYDDTRLMSSWNLRDRIARHTSFAFRIDIPKIDASHIERFGRAKALFARTYNMLASYALLRPALLLIGPFFRVTGTKR